MLRVVDNQYEDCIVHLVAEAYHDDITIDCVASALDDVTDDVTVIDGDIAGQWTCCSESWFLQFGQIQMFDNDVLCHLTACVEIVT